MDVVTTPGQQLYGPPPRTETKKRNKAGIERAVEVQVPAKNEKESQKAAQITTDKTINKTLKKPSDKQYQEILSVPETLEILLF